MLKIKTISICLPVPEVGTPLAGYGSCRVSSSAEDVLRASFISFLDGEDRPIVLGSIDVLFVVPQLVQDLRDLGVTENLLLFSTHTHNAPSIDRGLPLLGRIQENWYRAVVRAIAEAIYRLRAIDYDDVMLSYGEKCTKLNVNRRKSAFVLDYPALLKGKLNFGKRVVLARNRSGPVDQRLRIYVFETVDRPQAVFWTFAAHAAFDPGHTSVSADFPGFVREELEREFGLECCIVYAPGFAGSAIPDAPQRVFMPVRELCMRLLPFFPMLPSFSTSGYRRWAKELTRCLLMAYQNRTRVDDSGGGRVRFMQKKVDAIFDDPAQELQVGLMIYGLSLGRDAGIIAYSGEMLGEWHWHLSKLTSEKVILSGYAVGRPLYVPPTEQVAEGGYEVDRFQSYFGLHGHFCADITSRVVEATKQMAQLFR